MDVKKNVLYFGGGIKSQWFGHSMWTHGNIIALAVAACWLRLPLLRSDCLSEQVE